MMNLSFLSSLILASIVCASAVKRQECPLHGDDLCLNVVAYHEQNLIPQLIHINGCQSFLDKTVTLFINRTTTVTTTITSNASISISQPTIGTIGTIGTVGNVRRGQQIPTYTNHTLSRLQPSTKSIPSWVTAPACTDAAQYSSACSCLEFSGSTVTTKLPAYTETFVVTILSGAPSRPASSDEPINTISPSSSVPSQTSSSSIILSTGTGTGPIGTVGTIGTGGSSGTIPLPSSSPRWPNSTVSSGGSISSVGPTGTGGSSAGTAVSSSSAPPVSASSTCLAGPQTTLTSGYQPHIPCDYYYCDIDPNLPAAAINLLDGVSGRPIVNANGSALRVSPGTVTSVNVWFFFGPPNAPHGVYDLALYNGMGFRFLAVLTDGDDAGQVRFVDTSSNGQDSVDTVDGHKYVTTIWSVSCDGQLSAGIIGKQRLYPYFIRNVLEMLEAPSTTLVGSEVPGVKKRERLVSAGELMAVQTVQADPAIGQWIQRQMKD